MRKGIYVPAYPDEVNDLVCQTADLLTFNGDIDGFIAKLRLEKNIRLDGFTLKRLANFSRDVLVNEIHSQIATSAFGRPRIENGKMTIVSLSGKI